MANNIPKSSLLILGVGSGIGLAALAAYGATSDTQVITQSQSTNMYGIKTTTQTTTKSGYTSELRTKLASAYGYFAASLGLTGIATVAMSKSPLVYRLHQSPWLILGIGLVGSIGAIVATRSLSYQDNPIAKHLSWLTLIAVEGLTLAPITVLGGPLIMQAIIGTSCIVGSISLLTAVAPSDAWRQWSGIYGIGFGLLLGSSVGLMFFPGSNMLYNIVLYLGLAWHGWGVFRSTGRMIDHANNVPLSVYDPINESIGLFIHTMAIFYRMVMMLSNNRKK